MYRNVCMSTPVYVCMSVYVYVVGLIDIRVNLCTRMKINISVHVCLRTILKLIQFLWL